MPRNVFRPVLLGAAILAALSLAACTGDGSSPDAGALCGGEPPPGLECRSDVDESACAHEPEREYCDDICAAGRCYVCSDDEWEVGLQIDCTDGAFDAGTSDASTSDASTSGTDANSST